MSQSVTKENSSDDIAIIKADTQGIQAMHDILWARWCEQRQRLIEKIDSLPAVLRRNRDANPIEINSQDK